MGSRSDVDDQDKLSVLEQVSLKQGGGGVALKGNTNLTQVGVPISLGKTAGPGTGCVIFLGTNRDAAYNDCVLSFYVMIQGREVLFGTFTVDAAHVAANTNIEHRLTGCAAESWEVRITLFATVPAAPLQTSIMAFGVENIQTGGQDDGLTFSGSYVGPGAGATIGFSAPPLDESGTYVVTVEARIESSAVDPVDDTFSTEGVFAWKNIAGVVSLVPVVLSAPNTSSDASLAATTAGVGAGGGLAEVTFALPGTLDATTHTTVTISLLPLVTE
jgi:hypothetical protein